jgi:hypothetical protein
MVPLVAMNAVSAMRAHKKYLASGLLTCFVIVLVLLLVIDLLVSPLEHEHDYD